MPTYKLIYFNVKGRGELPRLLFAEAGVNFEDFRIEPADWPKHKPNTPFGKVPVLEIDGHPLPQSGAIVRYLAKEFNLDGATNLEAAYADMVLGALEDAGSKYPYEEKDEKKKAELIKKMLDENIRPTFDVFEKKFTEKLNKRKKEKKTDECFFIGEKCTFADFAIAVNAMQINELEDGFMNGYPNLKALNDRTMNRPNIKAWMNRNKKPAQTQF